jgi:competence protein ComEA
LAWQSRPVQIALAFLLGIAFTLAGLRLFGGQFTRPIEFDPNHVSPYRVNLNHASPEVLRQLPRIGPAMSDRIVAARPLESASDLDKVPGFGPITTERIAPHITLGESVVTTSAKPAIDLIDPNAASLEDLQRIPGIGPKMAQRIVDERGRKPFTKIEDLRRVYGIGPKTLEKLRPYFVFGH